MTSKPRGRLSIHINHLSSKLISSTVSCRQKSVIILPSQISLLAFLARFFAKSICVRIFASRPPRCTSWRRSCSARWRSARCCSRAFCTSATSAITKHPRTRGSEESQNVPRCKSCRQDPATLWIWMGLDKNATGEKEHQERHGVWALSAMVHDLRSMQINKSSSSPTSGGKKTWDWMNHQFVNIQPPFGRGLVYVSLGQMEVDGLSSHGLAVRPKEGSVYRL